MIKNYEEINIEQRRDKHRNRYNLCKMDVSKNSWKSGIEGSEKKDSNYTEYTQVDRRL